MTYEDSEPMVMDILDDNDEFLFVRLSKKRPNSTIQKRNYNTNTITNVLSPTEMSDSGVEMFTYCILGYSHGLVSIINTRSAPHAGALDRIFALHSREFKCELQSIPNNDLINELINGTSPEINRIQFEI